MSTLTDDFVEAWRALITAAVPDVAAHGIAEAEHAAMIPRQLQGSPITDQALPYCTLVINELRESDEWGLDNYVWEVRVGIYVVAEAVDDNAPLRAILEPIKDAMKTYELTTGQICELPGDMVYRLDEEPNLTFYSNDERVRAGWLMVDCLLGEMAG